MKETTCCFTGHRKISFFETFDITIKLKKEINELINNGYNTFICGGALGFDTICEMTILQARKKYPQIKLILALPCENQHAKWSGKDKEQYEKIKRECDKIVYIAKEYDENCMLKRNKYMVDHSSYCIFYLSKKTGGTAYTVNYAKEKGLKLKNIA